jgi:hypothetical protein
VPNVNRRTFTAAVCLRRDPKKFGKKNALSKDGEEKPNATDPNDLEVLKAELAEAMKSFKAKLGQLRPDGRLSPEALEVMRVRSPGMQLRDAPQLGDLCTIVSKGRTFEILAYNQNVSTKKEKKERGREVRAEKSTGPSLKPPKNISAIINPN